MNREIFYTLQDVKILIERWRKEYNHARPHSSLGYRPRAPQAFYPQPFTATLHTGWLQGLPYKVVQGMGAGQAKEAVIAVKDAQIEGLKLELENLRELFPARLKEHVNGIQNILEAHTSLLEQELSRIKDDVEEKNQRITQLEIELRNKKRAQKIIEKEKEELQQTLRLLEERAGTIERELSSTTLLIESSRHLVTSDLVAVEKRADPT